MGRVADPTRAHRCPTCGAETSRPRDCVECLEDPRRGEFIALCERLLAGEGDQDAQIERGRELRAAARWNQTAFRWLLGAARRRHLEGQRQRDIMLSKNGNHRVPRPKELARTAR